MNKDAVKPEIKIREEYAPGIISISIYGIENPDYARRCFSEALDKIAESEYKNEEVIKE